MVSMPLTWILKIIINEARSMERRPTHPGEILREDIIPELDMSVKEFADALHISRQHLHQILAEKKSVTPNVALRLGKLLGNGPDIWLKMQNACDLWEISRKIAPELQEIQTRQKVA